MEKLAKKKAKAERLISFIIIFTVIALFALVYLNNQNELVTQALMASIIIAWSMALLYLIQYFYRALQLLHGLLEVEPEEEEDYDLD